eukprot:5096613-Lingulodinium_polyedra.AAC.1
MESGVRMLARILLLLALAAPAASQGGEARGQAAQGTCGGVAEPSCCPAPLSCPRAPPPQQARTYAQAVSA